METMASRRNSGALSRSSRPQLRFRLAVALNNSSLDITNQNKTDVFKILCLAVLGRKKSLETSISEIMKQSIREGREAACIAKALNFAAFCGHTEIALNVFEVYKENNLEYDALMIIADTTKDNEIMKAVLTKYFNESKSSEKCLDHKKNLMKSTPSTFLETFTGINLNQNQSAKCEDGDRTNLLEKYSERGDEEVVELLLKLGAEPRRGTLHRLVDNSVKFPPAVVKYQNIYKLFVKYSIFCGRPNVENAVEWGWGNMQKLLSEKWEQEMTQMGKMNVLQYACALQAVELFGEIVNTEWVLRFTDPTYETITYDVTNFTPDTMLNTDQHPTNKCFIDWKCSWQCSVEPEKQSDHADVEKLSCLEYLLAHSYKNPRRAEVIMNKYPFHLLTQDYWTCSEIATIFFLAVHIVYMSFFTIAFVPQTDTYNASTAINQCGAC